MVRLRPYGRRRRSQATQRVGLRTGGCPPDRWRRAHRAPAFGRVQRLVNHAAETGTPLRINGNVPNEDLITNLPAGACVEVPCLVDRAGVHPCVVGALPPQLACLNRSNIAVQELVIKGHLERDPEAIYQAMALDPLTAAVCSLDEIWQLTDDMFAANERWLTQFS